MLLSSLRLQDLALLRIVREIAWQKDQTCYWSDLKLTCLCPHAN